MRLRTAAAARKLPPARTQEARSAHPAPRVLSVPHRHAINKCLARSCSVRGIRIVVVRDLAKVEARVRFPYPAPLVANVYKGFFRSRKIDGMFFPTISQLSARLDSSFRLPIRQQRHSGSRYEPFGG